VLATGVQGFQFVTGVQWLSNMFNGVALIVAVAFAVWRQESSGIRRRAGTGGEGTAGGARSEQLLAVGDPVIGVDRTAGIST
jgi:ribose transport system permease protein